MRTKLYRELHWFPALTHLLYPLLCSDQKQGASVAAVFRWADKTERSLELLFVRRCVNAADAWSGQVAFPGGRRQKQTGPTVDRSRAHVVAADADGSNQWTQWESLRETAQRETKEEVGLDLTLPYVNKSIVVAERLLGAVQWPCVAAYSCVCVLGGHACCCIDTCTGLARCRHFRRSSRARCTSAHKVLDRTRTNVNCCCVEVSGG